MSLLFPEHLSTLRKNNGFSQRKAAADLGISQALLSHYENGAREPGLSFVVRTCDYYGVSADYLLGRTESAPDYAEQQKQIRDLATQLRVMADKADAIIEDKNI